MDMDSAMDPREGLIEAARSCSEQHWPCRDLEVTTCLEAELDLCAHPSRLLLRLLKPMAFALVVASPAQPINHHVNG
jgi:hypothetical protein